ncbi:MAG: transferase hexapeptide repeat family protein [Kiloniellales bacterium]|nr:transferase hexapeptide repeat family protein [Kiloniellales bacterium]
MARVYALDGLTPAVDPSSFVHATAVLIGDVIIGRGCYVGPGAVLRGDIGRLVMEDGSNLQDNCVVHCFPGRDSVIEADGHVAHGAVLHGCTVKRNAMVGMNAVVMDGAVIGEDSFVGALAFVKAGFEVPPRHLVAGVPAKIVRELSAEEIDWKARGTREYQIIAQRCLTGLKEARPLEKPEANRPRFDASDLLPLIDTKAGEGD